MIPTRNSDILRTCLALYEQQDFFFPLIACVISGRQDGIVMTDDLIAPTAFYVEHAFGFAQFIGDISLESRLETLKTVLRQPDKAKKIRLYSDISFPENEITTLNSSTAERQRFVTKATANSVRETTRANSRFELCTTELQAPFVCERMTEAHLGCVEAEFNIAARFWRSEDDFLRQAMPVIVTHLSKPVAICYAAARHDLSGAMTSLVEIDILVQEQYRRQGLARAAANLFMTMCEAENAVPLWDCFTNNFGSMGLAKALGFYPRLKPYAFYTLVRPG